MKTIVIRANRRVDVLEEDKPKTNENLVVVKVLSSPMCTEFYEYRDGTESLCLGHEAAGEVVEVGQSNRVSVGDRVVVMPQYPCGSCELCLSGEYIHCENVVDPLEKCSCKTGVATYSQYVIKHDWLLVPIPDKMSFDHASMACCGLGASFGAVNMLNIGSQDIVLITGLGPVGLGAIINCRQSGAKVIGLARNPYRAALARELGAEYVLNPIEPNCLERILDLTGGLGVNKSIECSGGEIYQRMCINGTRRKGHLAFVGESNKLTLNISDDFIRKGLTMMGSWHWNLTDMHKMMDTIVSNSSLIDKLITHTFPLTQAEEAFKLQVNGNCGKVILHPWG